MTVPARPAVSLVVLTYNHERYIDQCLDSVSRQTLRDFEVVIVDDCSTDSTAERVRAWLQGTPLKAQLIANERNLGICASRNLGLRHCGGEFVAGLAGDDYYEPHKLERQLELFRALDDSVAATFGNARIVDEAGREIGVWFARSMDVPGDRMFDRLIRRNFLPAPTVMARRAAIDAVGGYDESLFYEDYDMWLRLANRYTFRYLPEVLANYRLLATSASRHPSNLALMNESTVRILLKWYGRAPALDDVVIRRAWRCAIRTFAADRRLGRAALRTVCGMRPSVRHRTTLAASALPGVHPLVAHAFSVWDWYRAGERTIHFGGR